MNLSIYTEQKMDRDVQKVAYDVSKTFITTFTCAYVSTLSESTLQRSF